MGHSGGLRAGTRTSDNGYTGSEERKERILNCCSLPYKYYHGKTGVVYNVTKSAVGVIIYKRVGNRYLEKRLNVRVEHVSHSRSREEFINRVKENAIKKRQAKEQGVHLHLKRQAVQPRDAHVVESAENFPETITPIPYDTHI
ncbi:hypothetical protein EIK77_004482 [Talaromyces pinophilus]|nr:hypothetical protein EIK77_004482 [Talaromyces pinophilus]